MTKLPKYIRVAGEINHSNFMFTHESEYTYRKNHGGWTIDVKIKSGKIMAHPTYKDVLHLKGVEFVECSPEEVESDKRFT